MESKTERIKFCLTDKELKQIERQAKKAGMNRSEYIRHLIKNCQLMKTPDIDYDKWHCELKALGDEFNRYVKAFNQTGVFNESKADAVCHRMIALGRQWSAELTELVVKEIEKAKGGSV